MFEWSVIDPLLIPIVTAEDDAKREEGEKYFQLYLDSTNLDLRLQYCEEAALMGHPMAQYLHGLALCKTEDLENIAEGLPWIYNAAAAENGQREAQLFLGEEYYTGKAIRQNNSKAVYWLTLAAEQGEPNAQILLGIYYRNLGGRKNLTEAVKWFRLAANHKDTYAQYVMGYYYCHGIIVKEDPKRGGKLLQMSAEQGGKFALYELGNCYLNGVGVEANTLTAIDYFQQAADRGDKSALYRIGEIYEEGIGVEKDIFQALHWYHEAAKGLYRPAIEKIRAFGYTNLF